MNVRQIDPEADVRRIISIQATAWREAYADILPPEVLANQSTDPDDAEVSRWLDGLSTNREGVLVAEDTTGTVRGFADFRWGDAETKEFVGPDEAGLKAIYVEPESWGEGIGTALLERGIERLPPSIETLRLEMLEGNEIGHAFYTSRGFEVTGETTHEIGGETYPTRIYSRRLE